VCFKIRILRKQILIPSSVGMKTFHQISEKIQLIWASQDCDCENGCVLEGDTVYSGPYVPDETVLYPRTQSFTRAIFTLNNNDVTAQWKTWLVVRSRIVMPFITSLFGLRNYMQRRWRQEQIYTTFWLILRFKELIKSQLHVQIHKAYYKNAVRWLDG